MGQQRIALHGALLLRKVEHLGSLLSRMVSAYILLARLRSCAWMGELQAFTTREAASRLNISESTLRAWERKFSFPKCWRNPNGRRLYQQADVMPPRWRSGRERSLETVMMPALDTIVRRCSDASAIWASRALGARGGSSALVDSPFGRPWGRRSSSATPRPLASARPRARPVLRTTGLRVIVLSAMAPDDPRELSRSDAACCADRGWFARHPAARWATRCPRQLRVCPVWSTGPRTERRRRPSGAARSPTNAADRIAGRAPS